MNPSDLAAALGDSRAAEWYRLNPMKTENTFDCWALVELFGHQRIIGRVTEQSIGGASFIRVDVPNRDGSTNYSRMFGAAAIYSINPIDRDTAISMAAKCCAEPVKPYEVPLIADRDDAKEVGDDGGMEDPDDAP